jgi:multisubunit Na+/H+ antiporter MnhB subunit
MKRFHLVFGLTIVVIFLLTGQYMDKRLDHLMYLADGPRMLFRTRHIYILMAGLLNIGIGSYFTYRPEPWRKRLRLIGSILIAGATLLFIVAFFYEPTLDRLKTPLSLAGMIAISSGTLLHLFSSLKIQEGNNQFTKRHETEDTK